LEKTGISFTFAAHLKLNQLNNNMIIIPIKEGENIERALKRFKRKFEKTGTMKELRSRQAFTKPSIVRREAIKKAIYIQQLQQKEE
jgi:small subunit ribosomal protein S21